MISEGGRLHGGSFFDSTDGRYGSRAHVDEKDATPYLDQTAGTDGKTLRSFKGQPSYF
jgi:hypothetical protein